MSLTIIKEGNKNFQHQDVDYADYGANDITIIFDGDTVKLRSISGRIVFDKDGYNYSDVTIIDNSTGGGAEVFPNIISLKQRLINLGYPFGGGSDEVVLNSVDWGNINGNIEVQGDLITKFNTKQDTLVSGTNIKTLNGETLLGSGDLTLDLGVVDSVVAGDNITVDNTDPANPIITGENGGVQSVVAGDNITVDNTDPANPIITGENGGVQSVVAGDNITVDNTDPANPIITGENGGVQSVTGSTNIDVDNTDLANPIVSLIGIIDSGTITITSNPLVDNLSLFYKFNETSGITSTDSSTNGNNGTIVNDVLINQVGLIDRCYSFNTDGGSNDYVVIPDSDTLSFGSDAFSIEVWLNPDANFGKIINKYNATSGNLEYRMFIQSSVLQFFIYTDATNNIGIADNVTISTGSWQQIVVTYDGSGDASGLKMKVDNTVASFAPVETGTFTGMPNTTQDVYLGQQADNLTSTTRYVGDMDILRIWKGYELSDAEITTLYNGGAGTETISTTNIFNTVFNTKFG